MRFLACLCAAATACHGSMPAVGPGDADCVPGSDGGTDGTTGAPTDGMPDAGSGDAGPLALIGVTPATDAWLHGPIRATFTGPVPACTVTATLDGAPIAATATSEGNAIAIALDPGARGMGTLAVHIEGAGDPIDRSWSLAPWSPATLDRGAAAGEPAIAVADDGTVYAAWLAGGQVVVGALADVAAPLGAPLGAAASPPAIALVAGAPVVAWSDGAQVQAARWQAGAWTALPSLGAGTAVRGAGGAFAVIGNGALSLASGGPALVVGDAVAFAADGPRAAAAWLAGGAVRAARFDGAAWTALDPLPAPGGTRVAIALRGDALAIAWDAVGGSAGVSAALAAGTGWTRLGQLLDIDPQDDATLPAIAIGPDGNPVVAWREDLEGTHLGVLARWDGAAWHPLGGRSWSADVAAPVLALHAGGAPVIASIANGGLAVARFDGPVDPGVGIAARTSLAGCALDPQNPPQLLSQTGCFDLSTPKHPVAHPGLVPYDVYVELWTDGAKKRRWIGLPDGAPAMTVSSTEAWSASPGTIMIKEFALETTPGNPATRRPMETRFLVDTAASGWLGVTYRWNLAGTDATLQTDGEFVFNWPMDDGSTHPHQYPSRSECQSCHENSYGPLLGVRSPQLNRWYAYDGVIAEQLPTLAHLGIGPGTAAAPFVSPHDPVETAEHRMRGYMATNCAHCHNPTHVGIWDGRYPTPLAQTGLCDKIVPGSPSQSIVYQKVSSRPGMPKLGSLAIDPLAVSLLGTWISGMTSCP